MANTRAPIPYGRQSITQQDIEAVERALTSAHLTTGPNVTDFEAALCVTTGAKYAIACANATAGLHLACLALELSKGSLGVTSAITFVASSNCLEFSGHRSDFIDIDPVSRCISLESLREYCETVAVPHVVIPVSFAGVPAPLGEINHLAEHYGFKVIEDAAHSIGSSYKWDGQWYQSGGCAHTDMAVLSFHPVKTITTGEGGAVLTNDDELAKKLRLYRAHGTVRGPEHTPPDQGAWYYEMIELGYNFRITDLQCALGTSQLSRLSEAKERRLEIVERYNSSLRDIPGVIGPQWSNDSSPCFHLAVFELPGETAFRKQIYDSLLTKNIQTQVHYIPVYWHPYYRNKYGFSRGKCQNAEKYYNSCLSLPLYVGLSDEEVAYVVDMFRTVVNECSVRSEVRTASWDHQ